jgi:hypothetical protein
MEGCGSLRKPTEGKRHPSPLAFRPLVLLFISLGLLMPGCKSPQDSLSNRFASVTIKDATRDQIETAIRTVFEKHGYELSTRHDAGALVFERKGTFMNGMMYGDWYSGGVWERVNVYYGEREPGRTVVECDAYMVQEHDDPFFQSERKPYKTRRHIYQKLLEEVAKELGGKKSD